MSHAGWVKVNNIISWYNIFSESISKVSTKDEQREISLNGIIYDFSVDHSSTKKKDILNIHQYIMIKNNIK